MDSKFIKLQLMKYFRFDRQFTFVCSECINHSDINSINDNTLVEVEIKISIQDFKKEFDGKSKIKAYKHKVLQGIKQGIKPKKGYIVPNYYYFCVTKDIKDFVLDYVNKFYPNYGLLVCSDKRIKKSNIYCVKKAVKIHNKKPSLSCIKKISKRVQSELITLKEKLLKEN